MRETGENRRVILRCAIIVLVIVFLLATGLLILKIWEGQQGKFPEHPEVETAFTYKGEEYTLKENVETFLVMGLDKFSGDFTADSYNNDRQSDFIMLFVFDKNEEKCTAIHINRDTMTSINVLGVAGQKIDTVTKQLALAHTYGNGKEVSCRNVADAVSGLLKGIKVNHYISVTMDSVPVFNDLVGGVELTVLDDFTGIDDTLIKGETVTLMGEHALNYVRTRYGLEDSTNSTRMDRQQQYLEALYNKTSECIAADDEFIINASIKMADFIESDRSVTQLQELMRKITTYEFCGIRDIDGESRLGEQFIEYYPNDNSVSKLVVDLFYVPKE